MIRRQLTCPNTPQQNGVAERKNRHLAEICKSMLHSMNVPARFWTECMKTIVHITNRLQQERLRFISPFEKLKKMIPIVSHFLAFGCVCYVFVPDHLRSKFDKKVVRCIFVGYNEQIEGQKCCDLATNRTYVSRNVVFDEASSWWSKEVSLPDSIALEQKLQDKLNEVEQGNKIETNQEVSPQKEKKSLWQTGACETPDELQEEEVQRGSQWQLRRSTRLKRPNTKYIDIALMRWLTSKRLLPLKKLQRVGIKINQRKWRSSKGMDVMMLARFQEPLTTNAKKKLSWCLGGVLRIHHQLNYLLKINQEIQNISELQRIEGRSLE